MNNKEPFVAASIQAQLFAASKALATRLGKDQEELLAQNNTGVEEPGYVAVAFKSDVAQDLRADLTLRFGNPVALQHDTTGDMYLLRQFGTDLQKCSRDYFIFSDCIVTVLPDRLVSDEKSQLYEALTEGDFPEQVALQMLSELEAIELTENELLSFQILLDSLELDVAQELSELVELETQRPDLRIVRDD